MDLDRAGRPMQLRKDAVCKSPYWIFIQRKKNSLKIQLIVQKNMLIDRFPSIFLFLVIYPRYSIIRVITHVSYFIQLKNYQLMIV